jgi:hypothetical protein
MVARLGVSRLEVLGREVRGHDRRTGFGRADGHVARARRDVEDALAGVDAARLNEHGPDLPDEFGGEALVVAETPGRAGGRLRLGALLRRHVVPPRVDRGECRELAQRSSRHAARYAAVTAAASPGPAICARGCRGPFWLVEQLGLRGEAAAAVREGRSSLRRMLVTCR